jgi:hypothetical protein
MNPEPDLSNPREEHGLSRKGVIYSLIVLFSCLTIAAIVYSNWNKVSVHGYEMNVAFDGNAPWGDVAPESEGDPAPTVLYFRLGQSYCYKAFQSQTLSSRLRQSGKNQVQVEYNIFSDFGHEKRSTLRSVDGVLLARGSQIIEDVRESGGQILLGADELSKCP